MIYQVVSNTLVHYMYKLLSLCFEISMTYTTLIIMIPHMVELPPDLHIQVACHKEDTDILTVKRVLFAAWGY